jgi:hypothetical protein
MHTTHPCKDRARVCRYALDPNNLLGRVTDDEVTG